MAAGRHLPPRGTESFYPLPQCVAPRPLRGFGVGGAVRPAADTAVLIGRAGMACRLRLPYQIFAASRLALPGG